MGLTKRQLMKAWKQLDGAQEAIERLAENGWDVHETNRIDESAIQDLKNQVEAVIQERTKKPEGEELR